MLNRISQGLLFLFGKYDEKNNKIAEEVLSPEEYSIFLRMGDYDRIHSVKVLKEVMNDELLKDDENYLKLALLHDCGKGKTGLISRMIVVLKKGDSGERHPEKSWDMLKDINPAVAELAGRHHEKKPDEKMERFQEIDDRN